MSAALRAAVLAAAALAACAPARREAAVVEAPAAPPEAAPAPPPGAAPAASPEPSTFGAAIDPSTPEVELAALARDPAAHEGRRVRARGTVHRVCQRAGCWMELAEDGVAPMFVPMAGHAFFLPREAEGRRAEVEGVIEVRDMSPGERAHLESEGATATARTAQLVASGVRLEPAREPGSSAAGESPSNRHGS